MKACLLSSLSGEQNENYYSSALYIEEVTAHFQFTDSSISYYKEYFGPEYDNYSIVVFDEAQPVLVLYAFSKGKRLAFFESPFQVITIDFPSTQKELDAFKALTTQLNELSKNGISELYFYEHSCLLSGFYSKITSAAMEFDACVQLTVEETAIRSNVRKSYKSLINWGEKNMNLQIVDQSTADKAVFDSFKDFHCKISGRKTRSDKSWDLQYEAICRDQAFAIGGYLNNQLVSFSYVMYGKTIAYYGVGVYDRDLMEENKPIAHCNIMRAITEARNRNKKLFDLGFIDSGGASQKEVNIFKFKQGFSNLMKARNKFLVDLTA